VESNEFPDADSIKARMLPICYEEGIFHGFAQGTPDFMNIATEMYIKDMLARLFASTRSNGPHWVKTAQYKRRMLREEQAWRKGEIRKSATGQLPIEQEQERNRTPLSLPDLRLALDIGGTPWGTHTPRAMRMFEATGVYDELAARERETSRGSSQGKMAGSMLAPPKPLTNGVLPNGVHTNGVHHEEEESGWLGGNDADRMELDRVLDDCLVGI
jgi:transcriptional coactivator HFI1/ADA1